MKSLFCIFLLISTVALAESVVFTGSFSVDNVATDADSAWLYIVYQNTDKDSVLVSPQAEGWGGQYRYQRTTTADSLGGWSGMWVFIDTIADARVNDVAVVTSAVLANVNRIAGDTSAANNLCRAIDGDSTTRGNKFQLRQIEVIGGTGNHHALYLDGPTTGYGLKIQDGIYAARSVGSALSLVSDAGKGVYIQSVDDGIYVVSSAGEGIYVESEGAGMYVYSNSGAGVDIGGETEGVIIQGGVDQGLLIHSNNNVGATIVGHAFNQGGVVNLGCDGDTAIALGDNTYLGDGKLYGRLPDIWRNQDTTNVDSSAIGSWLVNNTGGAASSGDTNHFEVEDIVDSMRVLMADSNLARYSKRDDYNQLVDGAITAAKIATSAIDSSKIAPSAIGATEIAADAIGNSEIALNAIGNSEIADWAIEVNTFAAGAISANAIQDAAIRFNYEATGFFNYLTDSVKVDVSTAATANGLMAEVRRADSLSIQDNFTFSEDSVLATGGGGSAEIDYDTLAGIVYDTMYVHRNDFKADVSALALESSVTAVRDSMDEAAQVADVSALALQTEVANLDGWNPANGILSWLQGDTLEWLASMVDSVRDSVETQSWSATASCVGVGTYSCTLTVLDTTHDATIAGAYVCVNIPTEDGTEYYLFSDANGHAVVLLNNGDYRAMAISQPGVYSTTDFTIAGAPLHDSILGYYPIISPPVSADLATVYGDFIIGNHDTLDAATVIFEFEGFTTVIDTSIDRVIACQPIIVQTDGNGHLELNLIKNENLVAAHGDTLVQPWWTGRVSKSTGVVVWQTRFFIDADSTTFNLGVESDAIQLVR